jgi:hypothetical protein
MKTSVGRSEREYKVKLKNFERYVDEVIVGRGRNYYRDGRVEQIEDAGDGLYVATVVGSDDYSVSVQLDDQGAIALADCDCPYTDGPYCKHMVAVFFAMREEHEFSASDFGDAAEYPKKKSAAKKDWHEQLRQELARQPQERLSQLLLSLVDEYPEIGDWLRAEFASGDEEKEKWIKLMRRYIEKAMEEDGFVNYRNCQYVIEGAHKVVERAQRAIDEKQYELAVDLFIGIMREMVELLQFAEDFTEEVGAVMDDVQGLLATVTGDISDGPAAEVCFQKLLREAGSDHYAGWMEWRRDLLYICVELATTGQQRERLEQYLDALLDKNQSAGASELSFSRKYETEAIAQLQYSLISKFDGAENAADFLHEHRYFSRFRELAIKKALAAGEYARAEELALEGQTHDEALPGLVRQWKECRFEVYRLWGQLDKMRAVGRELAGQGEFTYYQKLKALYDAEEWSEIYPGIVEALAKQPRYLDSAYTAVLIEEQDWAKLLEYVQKSPQRITDFYRHLLPAYQEQVYKLFSWIILDSAGRASNRSHYRNIRSHLRLLVKIGGGQIAAELVQRLLREHPRKPAFREELQSVKVK